MQPTEKIIVASTNRGLLELSQTLQACKSIPHTGFALLILKNQAILNKHIAPIDAKAKPSEAFMELSLKAQELIKKKDSAGVEALEKENPELMAERKEQMEEVNKLLDQPAEIELFRLTENLLPDSLSAEVMEKLSLLL